MREESMKRKSMDIEFCSNCRYLVEDTHDDDIENRSRECRRHAPVINPRVDETQPDRGWWPQVELHEWCGEWQARQR
jgi:hypothetical protein